MQHYSPVDMCGLDSPPRDLTTYLSVFSYPHNTTKLKFKVSAAYSISMLVVNAPKIAYNRLVRAVTNTHKYIFDYILLFERKYLH